MVKGGISRYGWLILLLLLVGLASTGARLYVDWLWFDSLGFGSVFGTALVSKILVTTAAFLFAFAIIYVNLAVARRNVLRDQPPPVNDEGRSIIYLNPETPWQRWLGARVSGWILLAISLFLAFILASIVGGKWAVVLQYLNSVPFGKTDPVFNKDIGFYVFSLKFYRLLYGYLMGTLIIATICTALLYLMTVTFEVFFADWREFSYSKKHLAVLVAAILFLKAWGYKLAGYALLYSPSGVVYGAGYADIHARLLGYKVLLVIALLVGLVIAMNVFLQKMSWIVAGLAVWVVSSVTLLGIYPWLVQKFAVEPNEFAREQQYIEHNIKMTREAYGLDRVESKTFNVQYNLGWDDIKNNEDTVRNIRLWDWQPLKKTYKEIQEIRLYYQFNDIDVDRYVIDGKYRQVMLAGRELAQDKLPEQARTWINQHLKYTHGYGVAMSPVNEVAQEGLPRLFIRDIPPRFLTDLKIERPEIYFGESTDQYVFVRTKTQEFDYPSGDKNVWTTYQDTSGVKINSFGRRLILAWVFHDYKILLSNDITSDSYVLFYRNIDERMRKIAPFLRFDGDPYLVIDSGQLYWIRDAYTLTDMYPYSAPFENSGANYIRNSVKVVVNAYTGETKFYLADSRDPVVRSYARIFPRLFTPMEKMPKGLRQHVRYPEDLFSVQAQMLAVYHMQDPRVFYNKEDKWNIPREIFEDQPRDMEPYYIIMRLPGEPEPEYILMMPFTPAKKQNMVAWLCARSDGEDYGRLLLFDFSKQELVFGPMQVESRINQDSRISQQLTLWNQRGSRAYRGNLMVIPINHSILYIEPLYLQAEQSQIPELRAVIAVYGDRVVMAESLDEAMVQLFGENQTAQETRPDLTPVAPGEVTLEELVKQAQDYYDQAQENLRQGNWAGYGENIEKLKTVLDSMEKKVAP